MTTEESLLATVAALKASVLTLSTQVDAVPSLITAVVNKVLADNPPGTNTGTVADAVILQALQDVTNSTRAVDVQAAAIPVFFEQQIAHGDPNWPNV